MEFNIKELTAKAHGYKAMPFPLLDAPKIVPDFEKIGNAVLGKTHLGRPYFMDVIIGGFRLPNEPLMTVSTQKRIVQTTIVGSERRGTVKELISSEDFKIKIEGICIVPGVKEYPHKQVEEIHQICEKKEALVFENWLAEKFGIHKVVVKSYGFGKMQGKAYSQSYFIDLVSDEDFYATIQYDL